MSDAAVATIVTGLVTITTVVIGFLTLWIKLRYGVGKVEENTARTQVVEDKIDANTNITRAVAAESTANAKIAASAARTAADKAVATGDRIVNMLNGALDDRIHSIVKEHFDPLSAAVQSHAEQDDKNMKEIRDALSELKDRIKP